MPIDDRIPDALGRAAGSLPTSAGDWDTIRSRAVSRRNRRRGHSGVALVAAAVLAGGIALGTGDNNDRSIVTSPPEGAEVVATIDGQVVVLSSDGQVVRTLSEGAPNLDATNVTVTPDGQTVYVQRGTQCDGTEPPSIWKMPARGGAAYNIGPPGSVGIAPLVSPDGRWLAYGGSANAAPGVCGPFDRLIVENLATGEQLHLDYTPVGAVVPIAWNATSSELSVFLNEDNVGTAVAAIAVSDDSLSEARRLVQPAGNGFSFLPSNEAVTAFPTGTISRIATWEPGTGAPVRVVAEISMPLYLIDVNRAGNAFLLEGPLADTIDGHDLYRAEIGNPDPVKIAEHVTDAVWLPSPPRPEGEIVAKVVDNGVPKIVILSAVDGHIIREVSADPVLANWGGVSVSPDARTAYITIGEPDPPTATCGSDREMTSTVARLDLSDGEITPLLRASGAPIISPEGGRLAYLAGLGGCTVLPDDRDTTLGMMDLGSGETARPYEGLTLPIAWSPDGSQLLTQGPSGDNRTTSFLVLDQFPFDPEPTQIEAPERLVTGTFLPDGRLVVVYVSEDPQRVMNDPAATYHVAVVDKRGKVTNQLFEVKANLQIQEIAADSSGRLLLLSRFGSLATWTPGDDEPVTIVRARGIVGDVPLEIQGATWLPSSQATSTTTATTASASAPRPDSIIAAQGGLVELSPSDGQVRRVIVTQADRLDGGIVDDLSVSADRSVAVVSGFDLAVRCPGNSGLYGGLSRVDVASGTLQSIDLGEGVQSVLDPTISPDGTQVAYIEWACDQARTVVVRNLVDGSVRRLASDSYPFAIGGWDSDGRHLVVINGPANDWVLVDTTSDRGLLDAPTVGAGVRVPVPLGTTGRWLIEREGVDDTGQRNVEVVEYDLTTQSLGRVLLSWSEPPDHQFFVEATDVSGHHILLVGNPNAGGSPVLYRWSEGDAQPRKLVEQVVHADW